MPCIRSPETSKLSEFGLAPQFLQLIPLSVAIQQPLPSTGALDRERLWAAAEAVPRLCTQGGRAGAATRAAGCRWVSSRTVCCQGKMLLVYFLTLNFGLPHGCRMGWVSLWWNFSKTLNHVSRNVSGWVLENLISKSLSELSRISVSADMDAMS